MFELEKKYGEYAKLRSKKNPFKKTKCKYCGHKIVMIKLPQYRNWVTLNIRDFYKYDVRVRDFHQCQEYLEAKENG